MDIGCRVKPGMTGLITVTPDSIRGTPDSIRGTPDLIRGTPDSIRGIPAPEPWTMDAGSSPA